jgi:hypothetical protein
MPVKALAVGGALAALWAVGVGITLSFRGMRLDGAGDWSFPSGSGVARPAARGLRVAAGPRVVALLSRNLAVFPHTCYSFRVEAAGGNGLGVEVGDEDGKSVLAPLTPIRRQVVFSSGGNRSVVVRLAGTTGGAATLERAALVRLHRSC